MFKCKGVLIDLSRLKCLIGNWVKLSGTIKNKKKITPRIDKERSVNHKRPR